MANGYDLYVSYAPDDDLDGSVGSLVVALQRQHRDIANRPLRIYAAGATLAGAQEALENSRVLLAVLSPNYCANQACRAEWASFVQRENQLGAPGDTMVAVYAATIPGLDEGVESRWFAEIGERCLLDLRAWRSASDSTPADAVLWVQRLDQEIDERLEKRARREAGRSTAPRHNPQFVGRRAALDALSAAFGRDPNEAVVALYGLPGMGKSAVAFEYAHAYARDYPGGRFLLPCTGVADLQSSLIGLASGLDVELSDDERHDSDAALARVADALSTGERRLLVLDNVDRPQLLSRERRAKWLRPGAAVDVLVTTRLEPSDLPDVDCIALDALSDDDGVAVLERWEPLLNEREREAALGIVHLLGGHPQAVELAAMFLARHPSVRPGDYLERLREGITTDQADSDCTKSGIRHRLADTLTPTLDSLSPAESLALEHAAFMAPDGVGLPWLQALVGARFPEMLGGVQPGRPNLWRQVERRLIGLRLLTPTDRPEVVRLQRVVRALERTRLGSCKADGSSALADRRRATIDFVQAQADVLAGRGVDESARWAVEPIVEMARTLLAEGDVVRGAQLANAACLSLNELGWLTVAHDLLTASLRTQVAAGLNRRAGFADTCIRLSKIEQDRNRLDEARDLLARALAVYEKIHPADHPDVGVVYDNLGGIEAKLGRLVAARDWLRRAVRIAELNWEPDEPRLGRIYNHLACVERDLGAFDVARELLGKALAISETADGPDHPDVAMYLSNLADVEMNLGHNETAGELAARSVAIGERVYPPYSPRVALYLQNWANVKRRQHQLDKAEQLAQRAAAVFAGLGESGVDMLLQTQFTLCEIHYDRGQNDPQAREKAMDEARNLYARRCARQDEDDAKSREIADWIADCEAAQRRDELA